MTDDERERLSKRYWQLEARIQAIHEGQTVQGSPADLEEKLLEEQDEIEFLLDEDYFEKRGNA